ncbi:MAG: hypothetical protein IPK06_02270 [Ignavibacteriae bacterium]|nr:hypothetical protein [Ignavibacteriota bacterium]
MDFFVGHSYSLTIFLDKIVGLPVSISETYPYRVGAATGWGESKWHSIFSWFASAFTFVGTLFIFIPIGYIYAITWQEAKYKNPFSIILFSILTLGLIFVPANNQLLHTPEGYLSTIFFILMWSFQHKRYNFIYPKCKYSLIFY